ncbi:hypothetical protein [Sorangium sp. So ce362]|uniref:hypothetical protein n=1 Tax=Sorangium sp. So ce362 TaxID=3133303 RepID=UPI003F63FFB6
MDQKPGPSAATVVPAHRPQMGRSMLDEYASEYRTVSKFLMEYGGLVAPFLLGGEWNALAAYCKSVQAKPPSSPAEVAAVERKVDEILVAHIYHPNFRAFYVYRASQLPHIRAFSHLVERGVLHYLKHDFVSCVLTLLPAVEGTLRSYCGWSFGDKDIKSPEIRRLLRSGKPKYEPSLHAAYASALADFHEKWLWTNTDRANFGLSYLNRHYALHGLGTSSYYRVEDCHRLILFFELVIELLTLEGHDEPYIFIPAHIDQINRRRDYYEKVIMRDTGIVDAIAVEESFMREHPHYAVEMRPPNEEEIVVRWAQIMGLSDGPKTAQRPTPPVYNRLYSLVRTGSRMLIKRWLRGRK